MTAEPLTVRPAFAGDLPVLAHLEQIAFTDFWPPEMLAFEIEHPRAVLLLAFKDERPVGYAAFRHAAGEAELLRLGVEPAERRLGVAQALVQEGLARLQAEGVQVCFLEVRLDNEPAIALYQRLGFVRNGRRRAYYQDGTDAFIYVLEL